MRPRERLRYHEPVPRVQHPGTAHRDVEATDRRTGVARQQHRTGLRDVARPPRAIDRKGRNPPFLDHGVHAEESPNSSPRTRSPDGAEPELLDDPRDVLAIEAATGHHRHIAITEVVRSRKHAPVPER